MRYSMTRQNIAMLRNVSLKDLGRRRELMRGFRSANELMSGVIYISVCRLSTARGQTNERRYKFRVYRFSTSSACWYALACQVADAETNEGGDTQTFRQSTKGKCQHLPAREY